MVTGAEGTGDCLVAATGHKGWKKGSFVWRDNIEQVETGITFALAIMQATVPITGQTVGTAGNKLTTTGNKS